MEPLMGMIVMFGGNFAPRGWALCNGQLLAISENEALFSILGTIYGGDGRTTFALPDLRGRVPVSAGAGPGLNDYRLGAKGGTEQVSLSAVQMPTHSHGVAIAASLGVSGEDATTAEASGAILGTAGGHTYVDAAPDQTLRAGAVQVDGNTTNTGGSQSHTNVQPFQAVNFIISLFGIYPSRQ